MSKKSKHSAKDKRPPAETPLAISRGELRRKLVHIGVGGFALILRFLTPVQAAFLAVAAFVFNWQVLPRIGGKSMWREGELRTGRARGILIYPLSVLGLILVFPDRLWMAAAIWGLLALGDGMASIIGQALLGPHLPWNSSKGWMGLIAFVLFGTLGSFGLAVWTNPELDPARTFVVMLALAFLASLVESMDTTLDDNLTVPVAGAVILPLLHGLDGLGANGLGLDFRLAQGFVVNAGFAWMALRSKSIDRIGAFSAVLIGTLITAGFGLQGFALMAGFFLIGTTVTKLGYAKKAARGIAQEKGGARGWRNAFANGGIPALLALFGLLSQGPARTAYLIAYAAAVATAAADTCSSEIGKAYGRRTFLITTFRPVPAGTEGAVSVEGTLGGLFGALFIASLGVLTGLFAADGALIVTLAGFLGALAESVIGTVAEKRGWLDNHALNALNT
ncbi:MAG: DUF92 domain-containing protein, partial [Vicinamibacteria bacterium]|nr:DUF92 domain-containing protein [Vicinamibacteria bacterium]